MNTWSWFIQFIGVFLALLGAVGGVVSVQAYFQAHPNPNIQKLSAKITLYFLTGIVLFSLILLPISILINGLANSANPSPSPQATLTEQQTLPPSTNAITPTEAPSPTPAPSPPAPLTLAIAKGQIQGGIPSDPEWSPCCGDDGKPFTGIYLGNGGTLTFHVNTAPGFYALQINTYSAWSAISKTVVVTVNGGNAITAQLVGNTQIHLQADNTIQFSQEDGYNSDAKCGTQDTRGCTNISSIVLTYQNNG
jgi:hypothetical protein